MLGLLLKEYYLYNMATVQCAYCEAIDDAVIKALGCVIMTFMPESVEEKCYGCSGVVREEGVPKFFSSQGDHDVCCMMKPEEQVDYISEDVIHKILTTPALRKELWSRVEVELNEKDKRLLKQLLNNTEPQERTVDEDCA